jgi:hypothetical protein
MTALKASTTLQSKNPATLTMLIALYHSVHDEAIGEGIMFSSRPDY